MRRYDLSQLNFLELTRESQSLDLSGCKKSMRIALLSDSAPQYLAPVLKTLLARNGVRAEIYTAEYDTVELEAFNPSSALYEFKPDKILIFNSVFALRGKYNASGMPGAAFAEEQAARLKAVWTILNERTDAAILQTNFVLPYERAFGNYEEKAGRFFYHAVQTLNRRLCENARGFHNVFINDIEALSSYYGRRQWLDEKMWILCKAFSSFDYLPHAVQNTVDILMSLSGGGIKCLVLDLDNTLWGGVIGDDGVAGIRLGHLGDGEAFSSFQHFLLDLKKRGILLAVCSKNDPENARRPFREHPEMALKEKDIAVFVANWGNKAENLRSIRDALNISFSSMAFIDDNPFERNLVRREIPEILVPEMPEDPADFSRHLAELNLFETTSFSDLDAERAEMYAVEAERKLVEKQFSTPEDYLKSLEMKMTLKRFDEFNLPRIAQLLQRSNQFNVLTRRFNEAQCGNFMQDAQRWMPLYVKLRDKYGDSGLISVVIGRVATDALLVEEWVMSCRVLSRGVEQSVMNRVFEFAKERGLRKVRARYEPTDKNGMVRDFFERFGFKKVNEGPEGSADWELETELYRPQPHFIELE